MTSGLPWIACLLALLLGSTAPAQAMNAALPDLSAITKKACTAKSHSRSYPINFSDPNGMDDGGTGTQQAPGGGVYITGDTAQMALEVVDSENSTAPDATDVAVGVLSVVAVGALLLSGGYLVLGIAAAVSELGLYAGLTSMTLEVGGLGSTSMAMAGGYPGPGPSPGGGYGGGEVQEVQLYKLVEIQLILRQLKGLIRHSVRTYCRETGAERWRP